MKSLSVEDCILGIKFWICVEDQVFPFSHPSVIILSRQSQWEQRRPWRSVLEQILVSQFLSPLLASWLHKVSCSVLLCAHSRGFSAPKDQSKILIALKKKSVSTVGYLPWVLCHANGKLTEYCQLVFSKGCNNVFRKQIIGTSFWLSTMWWWSDTGLEQRWQFPLFTEAPACHQS